MKNLFLPVILAHFAFTAFADPSPDIQNNQKETVPHQIKSSPPPLKEKSDISSLISAISSLTAQVKNYFYPKKELSDPLIKEDSGPSSVKEKPALSSDKARSPASARIRYSNPQSFAPAPQVVFFQKKNGHLVSKCQVSVKRHPKIFPPSLRNKLNDRLALTNRDNNVLDLKLCPANLSGRLAKSAQHYGRETQTAGIGMGLSYAMGCATGALMTFQGVKMINEAEEMRWLSKREQKSHKTAGIIATIGGIVASITGGWVAPAVVNLSFPVQSFSWIEPSDEQWRRAAGQMRAGAGIGALCSAAGGFLAYIYTRSKRDKREKRRMRRNKERTEGWTEGWTEKWPEHPGAPPPVPPPHK